MNTMMVIDGQDIQVYGDNPTAPDLSGDDWREQCEMIGSDGSDSYYTVGNLIIYTSDGEIITVEVLPPSESPEDWIATNYGGDAETAEYMAELGLDGLHQLTVATPDYDGPCRIWVEPHYYPGTCNAPQPGFVRDDNDEIIEYEDYATAKAAVKEYYNAPSVYEGIPQCNVMSHGQYAADTLTIVEA